MKGSGIEPRVWVAPSHSFDHTTLIVLQEETTIRIISDGLARRPYTERGFFWIPQQLWGLVEKGRGVWTACFHPNTMTSEDFAGLRDFCNRWSHLVISDLDELQRQYATRSRSLTDYFYKHLFALKMLTKRLARGTS
jgi:hypothetical protein